MKEAKKVFSEVKKKNFDEKKSTKQDSTFFLQKLNEIKQKSDEAAMEQLVSLKEKIGGYVIEAATQRNAKQKKEKKEKEGISVDGLYHPGQRGH